MRRVTLTSYQASHDIFDRLAKADPGNAGWQRDLALSYGCLAKVHAQHGTRASAISMFRQGQEIISRLAQRSPDNVTLRKRPYVVRPGNRRAESNEPGWQGRPAASQFARTRRASP